MKTFDNCGFGYWVYDIAVALWLYRMQAGWPAYRDAFFAGYAQHRPVPAAQLRHLDLFIAARETIMALWIAASAHTTPAFRTDLETELAVNAETVAQLLQGNERFYNAVA